MARPGCRTSCTSSTSTVARTQSFSRLRPSGSSLEHCWVAPFVEDSVEDLAATSPSERILFGSDWPHAEGMAEPRDFLKKVASFSAVDQRKIMAENARELTFGR